MLKTVRAWNPLARIAVISAMIFVLGLTACSDGGRSPQAPTRVIKRMSEVSPPVIIQSLGKMMEDYHPKVDISSPRSDAVLNDDTVTVRFRVQDFPLFQDEDLELGPHLNVILDNRFYGRVYDVSEPLVLPGVSPGTHTIRAIATLPWEESFKEPEAYAQATFHVFAKTPLNAPAAATPTLTFNQPIDTYGAEPILLDYVLSVDPETASGKTVTGVIDPATEGWQIRATVNGEPFTFEQWEPLYLKGFKSGKNWVQLELLDTAGQPIESLFNNTVRLIRYQPGGEDWLSRLMQDEVALEDVGTIVDPDYTPPVVVSEPDTLETTSDSIPSQAESSEPGPSEPGPSEPGPSAPESSESKASEPKSSEPATSESDESSPSPSPSPTPAPSSEPIESTGSSTVESELSPVSAPETGETQAIEESVPSTPSIEQDAAPPSSDSMGDNDGNTEQAAPLEESMDHDSSEKQEVNDRSLEESDYNSLDAVEGAEITDLDQRTPHPSPLHDLEPPRHGDQKSRQVLFI